jgi:hypothetical protein
VIVPRRSPFALGAIAAIAHLALGWYGRTTLGAPSRFFGGGEPGGDSNPGGLWMSKPTPRQLLRRHATPFAMAFGSLTVLLLANYAVQHVPPLVARGAPVGTIVEVLLLAVPFTLALTVPVAVFLAVSWVFMRLGAEGVLASARGERRGIRRLVAPVSGAAAVIATLTLVSNTEIVPRANTRLVTVFAGAPQEPSDRTMTVGELREAARRARSAFRVAAEGSRSTGDDTRLSRGCCR